MHSSRSSAAAWPDPARAFGAALPASAGRRYGMAVAFAAGALVLTRLFVDPLAGAHFLFSMGAVCLVALGAGAGPGLATVALCAAGYPLAAADGVASFSAAPGVHLTRVAVFLLVGAAQAVGAGALRDAYTDARRARLRCELRVQRQRRARVRAGVQLEMLRAITGDLAEGLYALDAEGRLVFLNAAASRMLGWTEEELAGREFHDVVHPRRADGTPLPASECPLHAVLREGRVVRGHDQVFVRKDGTAFPVAYSSSPIRRGGRIVGAALAFQDFGPHLRAEEGERFLAEAARALGESLDWEATLQRVAALAVPFLGDWCLVVVEQRGRPRSVAVVSSDPGRAAQARELLERYPIDLQAAHGVGRVLRTGQAELLAEVSPETFVPERGPDATLRAELLRRLGLSSYMAAPLVARGRTLGALAFGIAGGPRRYGEADLALARELAARCALALDNARLYLEARDATRSREELLAVVSHDLRAPLAAVLLSSQLVGRLVPPDAADLRRAADTAGRAATRAARLVDDLVDFARLERGKLPLRCEPHDPAAIAREAAAMADPLAREVGVALEVEAPAGAPALTCDRHRVLQVLANLLGNALKVVPDRGAVRLSVSCEGDEARFAVADTGPGIPPEDLPHVFERYWRGASAGYEGSGLGLAIARAVVDAHGGRIWASSEPGHGATFAFTLPLAGPPAGPAERPAGNLSGAAAPGHLEPDAGAKGAPGGSA